MKDLNFKLNEIEDDKIVDHFESVQAVEDDRRTVDHYGNKITIHYYEKELEAGGYWQQSVPGVPIAMHGTFTDYTFSPPRIYCLRTRLTGGTACFDQHEENQVAVYNLHGTDTYRIKIIVYLRGTV